MTESKAIIKPRTTVTSPIRSDDMGLLDRLSLAKVPDELMTITKSYFRDEDAEAENKIAAIRSDTYRLKQSYAVGLSNAYEILMRMIKRSQDDDTYMVCDITGDDENDSKPFTVEDWSRKHPGQMVAIEYVLRQLRLNGWQPALKPSTPEFVNHPCIQVLCDFRE